MEYNTSGIRTKRVSEEKTYNYIYAGDKLSLAIEMPPFSDG